MSRSNLSLLFPGCEALDDDINVDINTTGTPADAAEAATEAEDLATEGADTQAEAEETSTAAEAFAHQFSELCALHKHIARFGVDRTFLALCNRNNILGRALNLRLPATESFDNVGSPYSATSVACLEALSEGLWQKFKDFIARIVKAIKNFGLKMTQWWRELSGNYETRLKQFKDFFGDDGSNAKFKSANDLEGYKGFFMADASVDEITKEAEEYFGGTGTSDEDAKAAKSLIDRANTVIDAVLKMGSSEASLTGNGDSANVVDSQSSHGGTLSDEIKRLADDLGEKAQEARDKILDKLEEKRDKVNEKLDDKISDAKEIDWDTIIDKANAGHEANVNLKDGDNKTTKIANIMAKINTLIGEIRNASERNTLFSPALKVALDRLERNTISKNGAGMNIDTREAITKSVSVAQQIISKRGSIETYKGKILNIYFKDLTTIKAMCVAK